MREIKENFEEKEIASRKSTKFWHSVGRRTKHIFVKKREWNSSAREKETEENVYVVVKDKLKMIRDPEKDLLRSPCFYWPDLDSKTSANLLKHKADGSFIVRKSSHPEYKYAVTYKRDGKVASARIQFCRQKSLYSFNFASMYLPKTHTIRQLVIAVSGQSIAMRREDDKTESATSMRLDFPLHRPLSLMELCKARILDGYQNTEDIDELGYRLPKCLIVYLKQ